MHRLRVSLECVRDHDGDEYGERSRVELCSMLSVNGAATCRFSVVWVHARVAAMPWLEESFGCPCGCSGGAGAALRGDVLWHGQFDCGLQPAGSASGLV